MFGRLFLGTLVTLASVVVSPQAHAGESDLKACLAAIAGTFYSGCKFGASVEGKSCDGALQDVRSSCSSLRACRYACRGDKKSAKKRIKADFKTCKSSCAKSAKKGRCKSGCRQAKKTAMKAMRMTRSQCKKTCRDDYGDRDCKRARAKLVAWSAAMGAGMAAITKYCKP
jgi:hypothetical protein